MARTKPQPHLPSVQGHTDLEIGDDDERMWDLLQDPIGDPRLDEVPDSIRNPLCEIANALLAKRIEPTLERVATVARERGLPLLEPTLLAGLLMEIWWIRFNEIVPDDIEALQNHLKVAPVQAHRCCRFLQELIRDLNAYQSLCFQSDYAARNRR